MADAVAFVPQHHLDAKTNMDALVHLCKTRLSALGTSLDFDEDVWDISDAISRRSTRQYMRLVFCSLSAPGDRTPPMMREPFKSFAKAYMRYEQAMKPTQVLGTRIRALRALEAALLEAGTSDPVLVNSHTLNRAAQLIKDRWSADTAYVTAHRLELIARFLLDHRLVAAQPRWRSPIKQPSSNRNRIGKDADEYRAEKLPSEAALNALPNIFRSAVEPSDLMVSSITALLCSAPDRINEVLLLPVDCLVRQKRSNLHEDAVGLRWWPSKGAAPMVKWVIPSMASVVEEAIAKIIALTEEARVVARWYEQNPGKLYLPEELKHLRTKESLTAREVSDILFCDAPTTQSGLQWCRQNAIALESRGGDVYARFRDIEAAVLQALPPKFPIVCAETGLRYGEALCVIQKNSLHATKSKFRSVICSLKSSYINDRLGAKSPSLKMSSTRGVKSIFDRHGFYEPDGRPIRVHTHQFRHYLNTLAQAGGMSQLDIAKWSGRRDVKQNASYDQESTTAIVARIRAVVGDNTRMFGPLAAAPRGALIKRDEFARLKIPTAHTTDFGFCIHDFVMSPCPLHRDCLNCTEQLCLKGDVPKEERIRHAHSEAKRLLAMAEKAQSEGDLGAKEWIDHHHETLTKTSTLLSIFDNPSVPNGSVIQLSPPSLPAQVTEAQTQSAVPQDDEDVREGLKSSDTTS